MKKSECFDINTGWGSHVPALEKALALLPPGSLVIEHGAGMYSSPLIASFDLRVICIEEVAGWRSWVQWLYRSAGRYAELLERAKQSIGQLADAELVFIDGAARERGNMLKWALDAGVPTIIAHDTEDAQYGYDIDERKGYAIEHTDIMPRTTIWRRV